MTKTTRTNEEIEQELALLIELRHFVSEEQDRRVRARRAATLKETNRERRRLESLSNEELIALAARYRADSLGLTAREVAALAMELKRRALPLSKAAAALDELKHAMRLRDVEQRNVEIAPTMRIERK
jgi:hypothetical protein